MSANSSGSRCNSARSTASHNEHCSPPVRNTMVSTASRTRVLRPSLLFSTIPTTDQPTDFFRST